MMLKVQETLGQQTSAASSALSSTSSITATWTVSVGLLALAVGQVACSDADPADTAPTTSASTFEFSAVDAADVASLTGSESLTVDWIAEPTPISVVGGAYALGAGDFTAEAGTVQPGQRLRVRVRSACALGTTREVTLTIGEQSAGFRVTTASEGVALVSIDFPPGSSVATSESIAVRGTAATPEAVQFIRVNGVEATTANAFASWHARVPVPVGGTTLSVQTAGVHCQEPIVVARPDPAVASDLRAGSGLALGDPSGMAVDVVSRRLFVVDRDRQALLVVDLRPGSTFGARTLLSAPTPKEDTPLEAPVGLGFDRREQRVVLVERASNALVSISVASGSDQGTRAIVSDGGSGVSVASASALAWFSGNRRVLVADGELDALVAVDLPPDAAGERSVLSGAGRGEGPALTDPLAVGVDSARPRALVVTAEALVAVDLSTGDRTLVSSATGGAGPIWSADIAGLVVDAAGERALVLDGAASRVIAVDLKEGQSRGVRSLVSELTDSPRSIAHDDALAYVLVASMRDERGTVEAVDLISGDRVVVAR